MVGTEFLIECILRKALERRVDDDNISVCNLGTEWAVNIDGRAFVVDYDIRAEVPVPPGSVKDTTEAVS